MLPLWPILNAELHLQADTRQIKCECFNPGGEKVELFIRTRPSTHIWEDTQVPGCDFWFLLIIRLCLSFS